MKHHCHSGQEGSLRLPILIRNLTLNTTEIPDPKRSLSLGESLRPEATFRSGMTKACYNTRGTTLIELVLYFTLVGTILFAAMMFAIQILTIRAVQENRNELTVNRDFIVEKLEIAIREADSVNTASSIFDNNFGALALNMPSPGPTPVIFYVSGGDLFFQEGISDPERLNSDFAIVSSFRFHRVSFAKAPDQIVIDAELASLAADIPNLNKETDIHVSLSLRRL